MEDRYTKIERENRILLQKMSFIMTHNTIDNKNTKYTKKGAGRSMNASRRRKELERIMNENQSLLKRIQARKPRLSKKVWEKHHKDHLDRLKNMKNCDPRTLKSKSSSSSRRKRTHKLNPLDHGGFKTNTQGKADKPMGRSENRAKAAENVIYKEGRLIDDQYVIVTVIENIANRTFSFRTYALETSHQNRVDISGMTVRDCIDDDSLMRAEKHDELAMALIPRLRFVNQKLIFDSKSQHSEYRQNAVSVAKNAPSKLKKKIKEKDTKIEEETKKDIEQLDKEANEKLEKQIALSTKGSLREQREAEAIRKKAEAEEKKRLEKEAREKEEAELLEFEKEN